MSTKAHCPTCRVTLKIDDDKLHRVIRCPKCRNTFRLPAAAVAAPLPAAPRRSAAARTAGGRRPPPAAADDVNRTLPGSLPAPDQSLPPPLEDEAPAAPRRKGGRMGCVLVALLLLTLLGSGAAAGYVFFGDRLMALVASRDTPVDSAKPSQANAAFGRYGVIEIGSKGIKAFVVDFFETKDEDGYDFNLVWPAIKEARPTLVAGASGDVLDPKALDEVADYVKQFSTTMLEEDKVPRERIVVLCSSGPFVPFAKNPEAVEANKKALDERVKAASGCSVSFATARQEAELPMKSSVPHKDWNQAVYLDIGSGNTKGGYYEGPGVFAAMDINFGSVTYTKKVKDEAQRTGKPFAEQAADSRHAVLEMPLQERIDAKPGLARQNKVHLGGGAVWALATFTHPNDAGNRVRLSAADIDQYAALVRRPDKEVRNEVLAQVGDREQWNKIGEEIARVQKTFTAENLQAGAEILRALSNTYHFQDKQLYFFRWSHISWPLGFVVEKYVKK